jgi:hypothetical protein
MALAHLTYTCPMESETPYEMRRPAGLWVLTVALLASPVFHALALFLDTHWLNFGSHHPWDSFVYFLIAPVVGWLMLTRHAILRLCFPVLRDSTCDQDPLVTPGTPIGRLDHLPAASRGTPVPSVCGPPQSDGAAATQDSDAVSPKASHY